MAFNMKFVLVLCVLIAISCGLCESFKYEARELESEESVWHLYKRWSSHHRIVRSGNEMQHRLKVFKDNAKYVLKVNQEEGGSLKLKLNKFADMSNEEFSNTYGSNISHYQNLHAKKTNGRVGGFRYENAEDVPSSIDWTKKGAVNAIKDQSNRCGSCWAFAATAAVESIHQIKTKELVSLSEQQLVDCDRWDGGCGGGYYDSAFEFIIKNDGITTSKNYPYYAQNGYCSRGRDCHDKKVTIDGYENVPSNNQNALKKAVAHQPVAVAVASGGKNFQFYTNGIFKEGKRCGDRIDHTVVVVGYGTDEEGDYWLIRNSWGVDWGMNGYMKMQRGTRDPQGICGMAMSPSYPVKN